MSVYIPVWDFFSNSLLCRNHKRKKLQAPPPLGWSNRLAWYRQEQGRFQDFCSFGRLYHFILTGRAYRSLWQHVSMVPPSFHHLLGSGGPSDVQTCLKAHLTVLWDCVNPCFWKKLRDFPMSNQHFQIHPSLNSTKQVYKQGRIQQYPNNSELWNQWCWNLLSY